MTKAMTTTRRPRPPHAKPTIIAFFLLALSEPGTAGSGSAAEITALGIVIVTPAS